mmetsp:Transcript_83096/g.160548  ORF Transcript_83096/g.160548 Transcript_83096/m.160548 type:complete len:207 (-) Transcript_83096:568-1188(-)
MPATLIPQITPHPFFSKKHVSSTKVTTTTVVKIASPYAAPLAATWQVTTAEALPNTCGRSTCELPDNSPVLGCITKAVWPEMETSPVSLDHLMKPNPVQSTLKTAGRTAVGTRCLSSPFLQYSRPVSSSNSQAYSVGGSWMSCTRAMGRSRRACTALRLYRICGHKCAFSTMKDARTKSLNKTPRVAEREHWPPSRPEKSPARPPL